MADAHVEAVLTLKAYRAKVGRQEDPGPKVEVVFVTDDLDSISAIQWQLGREIKVVMEPYQPSLPVDQQGGGASRVTTVDSQGTVINTEMFGGEGEGDSGGEGLPEPSGEIVQNGVEHDAEGGDWRERTGLASSEADPEHENQEPAELAPRAGRRRGTRAAVAVEEPPAE